MVHSDVVLWQFVANRAEWADREVVLIEHCAKVVSCSRCGNDEAVVFVFKDFIHHGEIRCGKCFHSLGWAPKPKNIGKRRSLPPALRWRVIEAAGHRCTYCGRHVSQLDPELSEYIHVDHIVPVARGGTDDLENLVCSCSTCNLGKGAGQTDDDTCAVA